MNGRGVKPLLQRCGWWVIAALLPLLGALAARAQLSHVEATRFKHAFVDPKTGLRTMLLSGGNATNISNEELLLRDGVQLQFFDDAGKTNLEVASSACLYNLKTERVTSTNHLEAGSGSGQFSLEGDGFEYTRTNGSLAISNNVHAILREDLLASPASAPAAPAALQPGQPTNATRATNQFVRVFSDHLRYSTNLAVFEDNVRVEDPQGKLTCNRLTVTFSTPAKPDEKRQVENILAEQRVEIDSDEVHATGDQALYQQAADVVRLTGNPAWRLRQYEGRAEELIVNRKTRSFRALRNTEMTLPPGSIGQSGFLLPESPPATNASPAGGQPMLVQSEDFEFAPDLENTNLNLIVFRDKVRVSGKGILSCELMTIRSTVQSNRTENVVAERGVVMEQADRRVTGDKAVYTAASETVEVSGRPAWKMGPREGTADVLVFNLKDKSYRTTGHAVMRLPPEALGRSRWLLPASGQKTYAAGPAKNPGSPTNAHPAASVARTNRPARPVEISSDDAELRPDAANTNLNVATYRGHVQASDQDRMQLSCELLTVTSKSVPGTNEVDRVVAERNVDLSVHEPGVERRVRGDKAVYTAGNEQVEMTGAHGVEFEVADAKGASRATGEKAVYFGAKDVLELTGNPIPTVTTPAGTASGDVIVLDHANTTITATGMWKLKLSAAFLEKAVKPTPKPSSVNTGRPPADS